MKCFFCSEKQILIVDKLSIKNENLMLQNKNQNDKN